MSQDVTLNPQEFEQFQEYIERESGISLESGKEYLLESRLRPLMREHGCLNYKQLLDKTKSDGTGMVRNKVIDAMTTNETLWFRDMGPFRTFEEVILPDMAKKISQGKPKVRIWSAACSTGQEPYSLAMLADEFLDKLGGSQMNYSHFEIVATDISSRALNAAQNGIFDKLSMSRGMVERYQSKYFRQDKSFWEIDARLKRMITFKEFNLQKNFEELGLFDIIFCRNVAIYFSHDFKVGLFKKIHRALNPGGYFFLGSSESLTYYSNEFQIKDHKNATYYQV